MDGIVHFHFASEHVRGRLLSVTAVLVIHGMTREVQSRYPVRVEDLVYALKNVCIDIAAPYPTMRTRQSSQNQNGMQAQATQARRAQDATSVERSTTNRLASDDATAPNTQNSALVTRNV